MATGAQPRLEAGTKSIPTPRRPSAWGLVVLVVVTALSVVTWAVVRQGLDREKSDLLKNNAAQIQLLLQSTLTGLQGQLRTVAFLTSSADNSPTVFAQQAAPLRMQPGVSVALVDLRSQAGGQATGQQSVVDAVGPDLQPGEQLPPALAAIARNGSKALSAGVVRVGSHTLFVLAAAPTISPNVVTVEVSRIDPSKPVPNRSGPYQHVYVDLFNSATADPHQLILSTYGPGPLPGQVARAMLKAGNVTWLVEVSQRSSLIGGTAESTPWILLGSGIFLAVLLALFVELMVQRRRFADLLVEERTAELVETQQLVLRQERLAAVGEMASVVSHELRNPLSAVVNDLYLLRHRLGERLTPDAERNLNNAEREVFRAARLSEDVLSYTRERSPQWAELDFASLAAEVLETSPPPSGVDVVIDSSVPFRADPALMGQVLSNLVTNAYQAMSEGGTLRLAAERSDGSVVISVQDGGPGFDPDLSGRLFDPFFTTKEQGTGLGLAIVQRLVEAHGGAVTLENVPTGGARVQIRLTDGKQRS